MAALGRFWMRMQLAVLFLWRHRRLPRLSKPETYNEWVQWRKLNDRDPAVARLTDKLHAKALVARLDGSLVIPTIWQGTRLPEVAPWPMPFIVKSNHGCGHFQVVRDWEDWRRARRDAPRWLRSTYGKWLGEWHYRLASRLLLVEPFIGPESGLPVDYKVFVFAGRAECVQVHLDRATRHRWLRFDRDWSRLSPASDDVVAKPACLKRMLWAAELIAGTRDHLRVDFYIVAGEPRFGEFCLFPGSGLEPFDPLSLDAALGKLWSKARRRSDRPQAHPGLALPMRLA